MTPVTDPEKKFDLPPRGSRNPDPITNEPGAHPIETGIGAAVAGAAAGMALGTVAGPVAAAVGAAVGAVAGGYAGKGIGEMIDPTTEDNWLRDNFKSRPYVKEGDTFEKYHPAYRHGASAEARYGDAKFEAVESEVRSEWDKLGDTADYPWGDARGAVKDSYERSALIRKQRGQSELPDPLLED
jgi:phage tail tape-measure protein